tara:strand:- start:797 stop:1216 length:420 start_codon:yes stop_codon:yes gene_type:complete
MSDLDKMAEKYKTVEELRVYTNAQYTTIKKLNRKINELESDIEDIKSNKTEYKSSLLIPNVNGLSDEEAICIMELNKLRQRSMNDELTMEECKKVEAYVRTLLNLRDGDSAQVSQTANMSTQDLLTAMNSLSTDSAKAK